MYFGIILKSLTIYIIIQNTIENAADTYLELSSNEYGAHGPYDTIGNAKIYIILHIHVTGSVFWRIFF